MPCSRPYVCKRLLRLAMPICALVILLNAALDRPAFAQGINNQQPSEGAVATPNPLGGKSYVLILFLYDANKNYHVLRAGVYVNSIGCNSAGRNVLRSLTPSGKIQNQNYMCLEADLPY